MNSSSMSVGVWDKSPTVAAAATLIAVGTTAHTSEAVVVARVRHGHEAHVVGHQVAVVVEDIVKEPPHDRSERNARLADRSTQHSSAAAATRIRGVAADAAVSGMAATVRPCTAARSNRRAARTAASAAGVPSLGTPPWAHGAIGSRTTLPPLQAGSKWLAVVASTLGTVG